MEDFSGLKISKREGEKREDARFHEIFDFREWQRAYWYRLHGSIYALGFRLASTGRRNLVEYSPKPTHAGCFCKHNDISCKWRKLQSSCLIQRLYSINANRTGRRDSRIKASWLFTGHGKEMDACIEHSEATNEDILMFFFKLDLESRLQYALNTEQYEVAQQLRDKLTEVETELIRQEKAKRGSSRSEAQDKALCIIHMRADLQRAIDNEEYALASNLRDKISKLEVESLAASAAALTCENTKYAYRLGEKVRHKIFGYRAVICGMDSVCCESRSWIAIANIDKLSRGTNQPFYQVLVDVHDYPNLAVAYVPEENLIAIDKPDFGRFDHPYVSFLFYGADTSGDFIPIKQLREKFDRPRHEVTTDTENGSEDESS